MKAIAILLMFVMTMLTMAVNAGPAVDRARIAMEALKGGAVTDATGLAVLDAWNELDPVRARVECTPDPAPELPDVCVEVIDLYNAEEKAQLWMNRIYSWNLRRLTEYRQAAKRVELQAAQDALDAQIAAEAVNDL